MRKRAIEDLSADRLAHAETRRGSFGNNLVDPARLFPQSELAGLDVTRHAFGRRADESKFPIMDWTGAVHGDMCQKTPLHQIDQVSGHARA